MWSSPWSARGTLSRCRELREEDRNDRCLTVFMCTCLPEGMYVHHMYAGVLGDRKRAYDP